MHAPKTWLAATLITAVVTSAPLAATVTAQADTVDKTSASTANLSPLYRVAAKLPKVSANQLLKLAQSQVGISENGSGGGTKFHQWYMNSSRARETLNRDGGTVRAYANAPWCDMFVSWVGEQLGIRPVLGWDAYTVEHARWFKNNHRWGTVPQPGAVVFFSWSGSKRLDGINHVGFVIKDNGDGTIKTVEGNTGGGQVQIRTRPKSDVTGYGYPLYTAS
jgi:hypothetical protein